MLNSKDPAMLKPAKIILALGFLALTFLFAGCWASTFTLISPDKAKVDRNYVGDWDSVNPKGERATVAIRNLDDKLYYVEFRNAGKDEVSRFVGFLADVKTATFAHLRAIQDDGNIPDQWLLMRVELTGDKLVIRQLSDEYFKARNIESPEALRKVIEDNMAN